MTGTGSDDYVWISSTGEITLYENNHNWGYWSPWGVIYNANRARKEVSQTEAYVLGSSQS